MGVFGVPLGSVSGAGGRRVGVSCVLVVNGCASGGESDVFRPVCQGYFGRVSRDVRYRVEYGGGCVAIGRSMTPSRCWPGVALDPRGVSRTLPLYSPSVHERWGRVDSGV